MKRQLGWIAVTAALLCASQAWSQSSSSGSSSSSSSSQTLFTNSSPGGQSDSGQNGSTDTQNGAGDSSQLGQTGVSGPQDTFGHPESLPPLNLFGDVVSHTGLTLGTTMGVLPQYVTGNAANEWQTLSQFNGSIGLAQVRPTLAWAAGYSGGLDYTTGISGYSYTALNQSANGRITWNFAKRWQFKAKDSYFYSDDPFQPFYSLVSQPTPNQPNPVIYVPQAVIEQNQGHADLIYQLSAHDTVDFSGGESFQRYLRVTGYSLWNSVTYSGAAFYQHAFSSRLAAGGGYQFAALDFGHGQSRAGVQTFQGFVQYVFSPRITASVWIGPQYTSTKNIVPVFCSQYGCFVEIQHQSQWSVAEGGTLRWKISNGLVGMDFSHGVNNGGGLLGASNIYQVTGTYSRPLTRVWNLGAGINYSNSNSISYAGNQYLVSTTGTVGVSRQLFNDSWYLNAYYAFIHQSQNYALLPDVITTNGLGFTIRYTWNHGLGR